jgi:L-lactate dehydrogenase complex protein LldG
MSDARAEVLRRVRLALSDIPTGEAPGDVPVARDYRATDMKSHEERVACFVERVTEYRATVHRVEASDLSGTIASVCASRGVKTLAVPADLPEDWSASGVTLLRDLPLTNKQLNDADGVLTACALGIAQTGTIVLDRGPGQGRRSLTLLPDYHLCVIREDQIVGTVPEAVAALRESSSIPGRPQTWISGPSATSDIELSRVEGVHGPRMLEVLVVR